MQERSRSPAPPHAPQPGESAGLRVVSKDDGIRCPNRKCRKKLAEELIGTLTITCRHCGHRVTIFREA